MHDDRHGRLRHTAGDGLRRPPAGFRARDPRRFRQLLDDALLALPPGAATPLAGARVEVREIPDGQDLAGDGGDPWAAPAVPLARARADGGRVQHLVVFRRPAELRATDRDSLVEVLRAAVLEAVAEALGADPESWEES